MIIIPYSNPTQHAAGGKFDATTAAAITANFPACKHWWPCTETSGTTLTDRTAQGVILTGASSMTFVTNGVVPNRAAAGSTATGSFYNPTGKPLLFVSVGKHTTGGFTIGDNSLGAALSTGQGATACVKDASANNYPGTAFTNGGTTVYGRGVLVSSYNSATGLQTFEATATTTITSLAATTTADSTPTAAPLATDNLADMNTGTSKWVCATTTTTALYGVALFVFTTAPTAAQVQSWLSWITYQWSNGNKWLPPNMRGLS